LPPPGKPSPCCDGGGFSFSATCHGMSRKVLKNTLFAYQLPSKVPSLFSAKSEFVYGLNLDFFPAFFHRGPIICPTLPITLKK